MRGPGPSPQSVRLFVGGVLGRTGGAWNFRYYLLKTVVPAAYAYKS